MSGSYVDAWGVDLAFMGNPWVYLGCNASPYYLKSGGRITGDAYIYAYDTGAGNLGVGTLTPLQRLDVRGKGVFSENIGIGTLSPIQALDVRGDTYISGNIGIGTTIPLSGLHVNKNIYTPSNVGIGTLPGSPSLYVIGKSSSTILEYPPVALTANPQVVSGQTYGNGTYTVSFPDRYSYGADYALYSRTLGFNAVSFFGSFVGGVFVYTGASTTSYLPSGSYSGAIHTISMPVGFVPTSYSIRSVDTQYIPVSFMFFGTNVGEPAWTVLDDQSANTANLFPTTNYVKTLSATSKYSSYRLAIRTSGDAECRLQQLRIYGYASENVVNIQDSLYVNSEGLIGIGASNQVAKLHITNTGYIDCLRIDDETYPDTTPFIVKQDGNVGVGTVDPSSKLTVNGNMAIGSAYMGINAPTDSLIVSGNIGVGTVNPSTKLAVNGNMAIGSSYMGISAPVDSVIVSGNIGVGTTIALAKQHIYNTGAFDCFRVDDETAPDTTPFIVKQDGNVGVGTVNPNSKLSIIGGVTIGNYTVSPPSNGLIVSGSVGIGTTIALAKHHIYNPNAIDCFRVDDETAPDTTPFIIKKSPGYVGIGTVDPAAKLSVNGNMAIGSAFMGIDPPANSLIVSGSVGIGTSIPTAKMTIIQPTGTTNNALVLSGNGSGTGFTMNIAYNDSTPGSGNKQLWLGDADAIGVATANFIRFGVYRAFDLTTGLGAVLDAVSGDGTTRRKLSLGTAGDVNSGTIANQYLGVNGGQCIGNTYYTSPPAQNNLAVEGSVGIGAISPANKLSVIGNASIGSYTVNAPTDSLIVSGSVGIGNTNPANKLTVSGGASIGSYTATAPTNGLIVSGSVGIGTTNPLAATHLFYSGAGNALRIDTTPDGTFPYVMNANGSIGIGTVTPLACLHINQRSYYDNFIIANSTLPVSEPYFFVRTGGGVGIGINNPDAMLHIQTQTIQSDLVMRSLNGSTRLGTTYNIGDLGVINSVGGDTVIINENSTKKIHFTTGYNNNATLTVTNTRVGIGSTIPAQKLDVNGSIQVNSALFSISTQSLYLYAGTNAVYLGVNNVPIVYCASTALAPQQTNVDLGQQGAQWQNSWISGNANIGVPLTGGVSGFKTCVWYAGTNDSATTDDLNFGLQVNNTIASGANNRPNLILFTDNNSTQGAIGAYRNSFNGNYTGGLAFYIGSQPAGYIQGRPANTSEASKSLSEAMRITPDGRVGIGTITPQTTLDVFGNANIAGDTYFGYFGLFGATSGADYRQHFFKRAGSIIINAITTGTVLTDIAYALYAPGANADNFAGEFTLIAKTATTNTTNSAVGFAKHILWKRAGIFTVKQPTGGIEYNANFSTFTISMSGNNVRLSMSVIAGYTYVINWRFDGSM